MKTTLREEIDNIILKKSPIRNKELEEARDAILSLFTQFILENGVEERHSLIPFSMQLNRGDKDPLAEGFNRGAKAQQDKLMELLK